MALLALPVLPPPATFVAALSHAQGFADLLLSTPSVFFSHFQVISAVSRLSFHSIAQTKGIRPFPSEETTENDDDVYRSLEELADEHDLGEDIYDCVPCEDEGDDIYEDIIRVEVQQPMIRYMQKMGMTEDDKRNCCLLEIQETEAKYYKTLEDIEKNYMNPLRLVLTPQDMEAIFINLEDLIKVHFSFLRAIDVSMMSGGSSLAKVFLEFKERLLIYGKYCSHMEYAQNTLNHLLANREDVRQKVEECTLKVQDGKFKLQDLLVVPMQRVLKYHLLLKELLSHSSDRPEKQQLKEALEAMQDLAMYINEVKRDKETLKKISEFQSSIENLQVKLEEFGRPKIDGELKVRSIVNHTKQDRYLFLFDKVVIVCKRKGYNYELKEIIELLFHKMTDDPMNNKDIKKWSYGFYLIHLQGKQGFQFFCKTEEMKRKWMEQFEMAMSNIKPEKANANHHNFQMYTFEKTTNCKACRMFLRGTFYQGYLCPKCGAGAHKECLEIIPPCKMGSSADQDSLGAGPGPKMVAVQNYHGNPAPPGKPVLTFQIGDVIELLRGDPDSPWWEGRLLQTKKSGYFPSSSVKPCPVDARPPNSRPPSREIDYTAYPWFAGNMERHQTDNLLKSHVSGTYLIRERPAEAERFAISIKFNEEVKHIKVVEKDNWIHITEAKKFESLLELVEYYQSHSLKESFKQLDTTLKYPYKSRERSTSRTFTRSPVFTPRVIGTAVARYNFAARDMRELSLREGDVVKIYSRIGGDQGWWKGETNGRGTEEEEEEEEKEEEEESIRGRQGPHDIPAGKASAERALLVEMSYMSRAWRAAAPLPAPWRSPRPFSSSSGPTAKKSVPYQKTLQEEGPGSGEPTRPPPASAQVVVVGGGSLGCQTTYHLAKMGVSGVVLLERDRLTSGTTWHTAGLLWQLRPSDVEVELLAHTRDVVSRDLPAETGLHTGWVENGGLFIASNKQRLDEYKRLMSLGKVYGVESHVLTPSQTKDLYPLMNIDDLYGTLYVPKDGTMDPAGTCSTLARAATARGATIIENCPVTGIQVRTDDFGVKRVHAVETAHGTIQTPCVVNCAGVWARALGRLAGVHVPLVAMHHAYVVTERIEGIQNMPNVRDHDASVYLRLQGDALSVGGYESNPIFWEEVSENLLLASLTWTGTFSCNTLKVLSTECQFWRKQELNPLSAGQIFPDLHPRQSGVELKPSLQWQLEVVPDTEPKPCTLGLALKSTRRFHHSLTDNNRWIRERSHESYAKNYSVVFPHDEPLAGRNVRKDPLHEVLDYDYYGAYGRQRHSDYTYNRLLGDEYTFDFPPHHDIIKKECLTCRNALALFDMSYFGKFYLVGPDATKAADWLFSADVSKAPGSTVYTCMLNRQGGVESDLTVSRISPGAPGSPLAPAFEGDGYYLAIGGAVAQHNWSHITTVLQDMKFQCKLLDCSEELGMMSIQGPLSRVVLQEVLDTDLSNEAFPFSTHKITTAAGCQVRAMRLSFVGEMGWELHVPRADCVKVYRAVMQAGARHGIANAGYRAIDSLSIEKGYRHWHADLRPDDTPLEAGLAFTCKLKSSIPFLGREAVEAQKAEGIFRRLVCFTTEEKVPMFGLEAVWRDGKVVGHIRRADFGFAIDKTIAYGYIRDPAGGPVSLDFVKSGSYELERMGVTFPARAHTKSPFDPDNKRVKGFY
ncbi:hypothetical protein DUI87_30060 [Hirundo rustica rustica]|uniref:Sarcosine dehydrogenase, mitochondrial n=1 Tax=Hirundo rustica rustica TaxID=333673 RepID=A0A3M0JF58_HIRRU|nr:hypothetical protein DUI87_30060 [Hirundo rustica rustica]